MDQQDYKAVTEALLADARTMDGVWAELRGYFMPRTQAEADLDEHPRDSDRRFNEEAAKSLAILSGAHVTLITPATDDWMSFAPPLGSKYESGGGKDWYDNASRITMKLLSRSNFMSAIKLFFDDRCGLGTACVKTEKRRGGGVFFRHIPVGTFGMGQNEYGEVDKLVRRFKYTPDQAVHQYGEQALEGTVVLQDFRMPSRRYSTHHEFYELVMPNEDDVWHDHKGMTPRRHKAFRSVHMLAVDYKVVQEGGYDSFPYCVSRFLPWGESVWGEPPAWKARRSMRAVDKLEKVMDLLGEKAAVPPILELADQVKQVDLRAGGRTVVSQEAVATGLPREWANAGKYDIGLERIESKEKKIRDAFFVTFIQPVTSTPDSKDMTATEVNRRVAETIYPIVPSIYQCFEDLKMLLKRVFMLLYEAGLFNMDGQQVPQELMVTRPRGDGNTETRLELPEVELCGRMVQTLKQQENTGFEQWVTSIASYVANTQDTRPLDLVDSRAGFREMAQVYRVSPDNVVDEYTIEQQDSERAQQQQEAQQAEVNNVQSQATRNNAQAAAALQMRQ